MGCRALRVAAVASYGWLDGWGPAVECLAVSPTKPQRLAIGTSGHVFGSDAAGATWQQRYCRQLPDGRFTGNGLEVTCLNAIVPDPVKRGRLWCCYADIGLLRSDNGGQTFRRSSAGMKHRGNCFTVVVDPKSPSTIWASTGQWESNQGDVCRSDDDGRTWRPVGKPETGLPNGETRHLVLDSTSPVNQRRLLVTSKGNGLYETRDGGRSWQAIHGNLPGQAAKEPRGLLLDPADPSHLMVALGATPEKGGGTYGTRDAGQSWVRLHEAPLFADITSLAAEPHNFDVRYVSTRQYYDRATGKSYPGGLFASRDGGRTWRRILDFRFVQTVAVSPADPRVIYAGTSDHPYHDGCVAEGLLKTTDGGRTWRHENAGLSHRNISCVSIDPHDPSLLYVGTSGNGVFSGKDTAVNVSSVNDGQR